MLSPQTTVRGWASTQSNLCRAHVIYLFQSPQEGARFGQLLVPLTDLPMKKWLPTLDWIIAVCLAAAGLFGGLDIMQDHLKEAVPRIPSIVFSISLGITVVASVLAIAAVIARVIISGAEQFSHTEAFLELNHAQRYDIVPIHMIAHRQISRTISPVARAERLLTKNSSCYWTLRMFFLYRNGSIKSKVVGYFSMHPLNEEAAKRVASGQLTGLDLDEEHIVAPTEKPFAVYVGGIAGNNTYARGMLMFNLSKKLYDAKKKGVHYVFARGATDKGVNLLENWGFSKIWEDKGIPVYRLDLKNLPQRTEEKLNASKRFI